ncbi:GNAT family N-acetyltransferase [Acinetobacter sp. SWBY1]|uniref:GNAT family N-acetyltransferase n=1 Tax=Acinetobacter sp. SWBY1 TaxID=2079596 RepID=UPI000CF1CF73|nr:GNAT family N-acetyltransferase [Acinetobacter sp. SWBY1]AVH48990.1 GNAT family N-acetyltransferase [Acinetobacter sp. SWBY1]
MQVRPATLKDMPSLLAMARQFILEAPNYSGRELDENALKENLTAVIQGQGAIFVTEHKDALTGGIVCLTTKDWFNNQIIAFEQVFYVVPEYRSTQSALLLIDSFVGWSKHMNAKRVQCGTTTGISTDGCVRLYRHFGFTEYGILMDLEL